jgi:hypothetical protein
MRRRVFLLGSFGVAIACVSSACGSSSSGAGSRALDDAGEGTSPEGGVTATGDGGGGNGGAHEITPSPNTPAAGCVQGTTACLPYGSDGANVLVCTDTQTDAFNCGACNRQCNVGPGAQSCMNAQCQDGGACPSGVVCEGECIHDRGSNPNHCGGCGNRCGERELCAHLACIDGGGGTGLSCDSPLILPDSGGTSGFHFGGALTSTHTFACGPLKALPTRWLRMTATRTGPQQVKLYSPESAGIVAEVFESPCPGDGGVSLSCKSGGNAGPNFTFAAVEGRTYAIAVGVSSGAPSALSISF